MLKAPYEHCLPEQPCSPGASINLACDENLAGASGESSVLLVGIQ